MADTASLFNVVCLTLNNNDPPNGLKADEVIFYQLRIADAHDVLIC